MPYGFDKWGVFCSSSTSFDVLQNNVTNLFEDLCSHVVVAVKDNAELAAPLHLLEQRPHVLRIKRELADLQPNVVPGRSHDQLL